MSHSLTILHVTNNYTPYSGGVVSSINTCVEAQSAAGHNAHIITLAFEGAPHNEPSWIHRIGIPVALRYKTNALALPLSARRFMRQLFDQLQPNIVHIHHPFLLGYRALRIAKSRNIPVVFTYHTLYRAYTHYFPLPRIFMQWLIDRTVNRVAQQVDHIVCPSPAIQQLLLAQHITTPSTVVPSAVDASLLHATCPQRTAVCDRIMKLLIVSRLVPEKNLYVALDLFAKLSPHKYQLTIVGYGFLEKQLRDYSAKIAPKHAIEFIIKPSKAELHHIYETHDIFLFTSLVDTQAIVLAEAMAAGIPIIALDGPGQRAIIINNYNGYIEKNIDMLCKRIQEIKNDNTLFVELSHNAWQTSRKYTAEATTRALEKIYYATKGAQP